MAKRRSKKPNLPKETLERARQQAAGEAPSEQDAAPEKDESSARSSASRRSEPSARRRKVAPVQLENGRVRRERGELDHETIERLLEHPTQTVSEEELRSEYQHVLIDLRNMGLLAAALMVFMVVMAQLL